jgi:hypothetical protein
MHNCTSYENDAGMVNGWYVHFQLRVVFSKIYLYCILAGSSPSTRNTQQVASGSGITYKNTLTMLPNVDVIYIPAFNL